MKKLVIVTMMFLAMLPCVQVKAKNASKSELKSEIKSTREDLRLERKEFNYLKDEDVSNITKANFQNDFGNIADVKWSNVGPFAVASYTKKTANR